MFAVDLAQTRVLVRLQIGACAPEPRQDAGPQNIDLGRDPILESLAFLPSALFVKLTRTQADLSLQHIDHQAQALVSSRFTVHGWHSTLCLSSSAPVGYSIRVKRRLE